MAHSIIGAAPAPATPLTEFDANLAVIRWHVPGVSDREAMSLARLDEASMLGSLSQLRAHAKLRPIVFERDMAACQAQTDADPSLLDGYRPI